MPMDKTFNATEAEARIYAAWEQAGAFRAGANASRDETFSIMIPPPNVTGNLHMGHAFNNTLQDILIRWHRMRGFDTLWQPGTDHAGIATQMVVERELAKEGNESRREMGREKFLGRVWEQKQKSRGNIRGQLERLGASCDWDREAFTMAGAPGDPGDTPGGQNFHDAVIKVFVDMYDKGLIYRGKRLVNWDPHFETAISDLEVEQVEVDGHMWRLRYPLEDGATFEYVETDEDGTVTFRETRNYITVATTRPETMLGDTGVAVHPEDARYAHLIGKTVRLPLVGRSIPIVADSYADPTKGTGAVKITPAHDFNDRDVGARTGLASINVMTTRAAMFIKGNDALADGADADGIARLAEALDGVDRYEARDWIIQTAEDEGWLDGIDADRHMVPHGDRSKVAIEPYLTDQWFVDAEKIVGPAITAVEDGTVNILPEQDKKVYFNWLREIEPWCISRQLWWGHQIPVWYGPGVTPEGRADYNDEKAFCGASWDEVAEQARAFYGVAEVHEKDGLASALEDQLESFSHEESAVSLYRDPDVLDTWFSSGLWPIGTLGWPEETEAYKKYFPTSVLITGFDIIFFWVARMMMMQYAVVGERPFDAVYVHALVRDEKGKKMSKSLGNVLDPLDLVDEFGADAVRFTLTSMAAMGRDLKLSTQRIAGYRNFGTKLWNAFRFAEMNEVYGGSRASGTVPVVAAKHTVNRWIIGETARVREEVDTALANYRFNDAANALYAFVWGKVCDWYLEFSKPLFGSEDDEIIEETRATMAWVLDQCLILLHPIMPFVTEELWGQSAARAKMLIHADWPDYQAVDLVDETAESELRWVIALIEAVRSVRGEMNVPASLKVDLLQLELDEAGQTAWDRNADIIQRLARIESVEVADQAPKGAATITVPGGTYALPLADIIDVSAEKARLEKSLQKLGKELGGLRGRLGNPKFLDSAPDDVVEETRELAAEKEAEEIRLKTALARLAEVA
ncbi:MAG: valine--tRNA ligase [Rhodobacteraceae bacterium]|nr:valine--tRNA ligase [Paracoccaceae bacterium]